jgi:uncharacterized membrane protein YcjF (UPF0283 family)
MTVKEEAEALVNEYRMILMNEDTDCGEEILCTSIAKQCALRSIHKTLLVLEHIEEHLNDGFIYSLKSRYMQIRTEIKKL